MDQLLSQLIPTQRIGNDGFIWWIGQIEGTAADEANNKGGYRYKVRIIGDHPRDKELLDTPQLPWANVLMPVTAPFMPGNIGGGHPQLVKGCWVMGFYMDVEKQKPIIMGSIGQTPGATSVLPQKGPDAKPFTSGAESGDLTPNPNTDGDPTQDEQQKTTGALPDGTKRGDGEERVNTPQKKLAALKQEEWCQEVAEKCKDVDLKTQMNSILGTFLKDVQNSNGRVGTKYVNEATGELNSAINDARTAVNKATSVITEFLAKIKGWIKKKIQEAVEALVKAVLAPEPTGNVLTPVTEFFNNILKDLGCKMEDLGERLIEWLTNVIMSYVQQIYRAAICQVDELVNGIISKINQLLNELLESVLGPLQDILGAIAAPLNIIGEAINYIMQLLGISCSGPDQTCSKYKLHCTTGEKKEDEDDKGFLDGLLDSIDNLFGDTPADYTQYVCDEAYTGRPLSVTTVGFTGGVPALGGSGGDSTKKPIITYKIEDITVKEGSIAKFAVTRSGYLDEASSIKYKTLKNQGSATEGEDYVGVDGILGFAPNETVKYIDVQTIADNVDEPNQEFYMYLRKNSPTSGSVSTVFKKNVGKCTITEQNVKEPGSPYTPPIANPLDPIGPEDPTSILPEFPGSTTELTDTTDTTPTFEVNANRITCPEGEFIIYTISTTNVDNGTIVYYTLSGKDITSQDIVGASLNGTAVINNDQAKVTVGIADDGVVEDPETLRFTLNGKGKFVDVIITTADDQSVEDYDEGVGDGLETVFSPFEPPSIDPTKIITDENGGIIEIPVDKPGDPWAEAPYVFIGGEGFGGAATALLDENGFLTEIRVKRPGYGYKKNLASDLDVRCIIDSFTILRPGIGYTETPKMYVDGELGVAEAVINDDGLVIGARILDRTRTFDRFPAIDIVGGNGYGAKLLPSLACLDTDALSTIGATKIGTGQYIDCP
jgi:hypothetical protein